MPKPIVPLKTLLECGVHFGHKTSRWNPKMKPYIYTQRNGVHIIDLQKTQKALREAYDLIRDTVAQGGIVLFVGTKHQARDIIEDAAKRVGMPYVNYKWLGGMLTNWRTIYQRVRYLEELERMEQEGILERLSKKEAIRLRRQMEKLRQRLSGIRHMTRLPDLVFIVDVCQEETAVREANRLNIPVVAMVDTNCDPTNIDYIIPANDDAIRSIKLIVNLMADAVEEGLRLREKLLAEQQAEAQAQEAPVEEEAEEVPVEAYLGESTLRKIRAQSEETAEAEAAQPAASEAATAQAPEAQGEPTGEAVEDAVAEADEVEERA